MDRNDYCSGCFGCQKPCEQKNKETFKEIKKEIKKKEVMNLALKIKLMYTFLGYCFCFLNLYGIKTGQHGLGTVCGFISLGLFLKALSIRPPNNGNK